MLHISAKGLGIPMFSEQILSKISDFNEIPQNSKTAWRTEILMLFLNSLDNLL